MAIIGTIRKKAGVAVVFITVAILAFIFTDLFSKGDTRPNKLASVNGSDISFVEFENAVANVENNMKQQYVCKEKRS